MDRAVIINRIIKVGLRDQADALRDKLRRQHLADGDNKGDALTAAWSDMWVEFEPIVIELESQRDGTPLRGCPDDVTPFLDPNYSETDPGKQLRDGLLWAAFAIRLVVRDTSEGTVIDLSLASPPPSAWAVFVLECYAMKPPAQRAELIAKVLPFATRQHDTPSGSSGGEGFLSGIGKGEETSGFTVGDKVTTPQGEAVVQEYPLNGDPNLVEVRFPQEEGAPYTFFPVEDVSKRGKGKGG